VAQYEAVERSLFSGAPVEVEEAVSAAEQERQDDFAREVALMDRYVSELRMGHGVLELTSV
jgi:hypothetical protein